MMSSIQKELVEATGVKPKKLERQAFIKKLFKAAEALEEVDWLKLSNPAQLWVNACIDADDKHLKEYPEMPDYEASQEPEADADADADADDAASDDDATKGDNEVATEKKAKKSKKPAANGKSTKSKDKAKPAKAKAASKGGVGQKGDGYKGHRVGSNKERAHKLFDDLGAEKAKPKVEALGMTKATIATWFNAFKKAGKAKK